MNMRAVQGEFKGDTRAKLVRESVVNFTTAKYLVGFSGEFWFVCFSLLVTLVSGAT